jgi:hypothetical protein
MSIVLMTLKRFANNRARVHIRSFKTLVDNVAASPRLTVFGAMAASTAGGNTGPCFGAGALVVGVFGGAGTGASAEVSATDATGGGTTAASGATGALPFLPPVTAVFATVTRAFASAVVSARATVGAALVSSDVVFGSLVFLVMSQAP